MAMYKVIRACGHEEKMDIDGGLAWVNFQLSLGREKKCRACRKNDEGYMPELIVDQPDERTQDGYVEIFASPGHVTVKYPSTKAFVSTMERTIFTKCRKYIWEYKWEKSSYFSDEEEAQCAIDLAGDVASDLMESGFRCIYKYDGLCYNLFKMRK